MTFSYRFAYLTRSFIPANGLATVATNARSYTVGQDFVYAGTFGPSHHCM